MGREGSGGRQVACTATKAGKGRRSKASPINGQVAGRRAKACHVHLSQGKANKGILPPKREG